MTCTTTHHACDCVLKRMAKLENILSAAKLAIDSTPHKFECVTKNGISCVCWQIHINRALRELEE